ncbi:MAG: response regulator transcription factor [Rubrobacteraceae bacterium]|nr:response regulator transcription factor [Rubrobacteraceae bacterium]
MRRKRRSLARAVGMIYQPKDSPKPLGIVWVDCPRSVVSAGLVRALEEKATVHQGPKPPGDAPSCVILCANGHESLSERVEFYRELSPDSPPVVVFAPQLDLPLARDALQAGASGFVHAEMTPDQLVRAVAVAATGELVAPRELLRYVLIKDRAGDLAALSVRQREILGYVVEGLSNAEIGRRLYLSESTIKQHLRAAYKLLGVSNRTEAANLFRRGD